MNVMYLSISPSLAVIVNLLIKKIVTVAKEAVSNRPLAGGKGPA